MYGINLARFSFYDNLERIWFLEEIFLLIITSMKIVLRMLFWASSNTNFQFHAEELIWKSYIVVEALPTTSQVKLIDKREFAKVVLDKNFETFIIYVGA